jgi:hypothetical protein
LDSLALACAVDRRMRVSSVRAVSGEVCGGGGGVSFLTARPHIRGGYPQLTLFWLLARSSFLSAA